MHKTIKPIDVLVGEANDGHAELVEASLRESGIVNRLYRGRDGTETLAFARQVRRRGKDASDAVSLMLLDCGLPRVGGVGVSLAAGEAQRAVLKEPDEATVGAIQDLITALGPAPLVILCVAVVPALAEELLFRGLVLQAFRGILRNGGAVVVSALGFGLFHMNLHRIFPQAALGVLLAVIVLRTGSIWPAVLAHAVHNAILVGWTLSSGDLEAEVAPAHLPFIFVGGALFVGLSLYVSRTTRTESVP